MTTQPITEFPAGIVAGLPKKSEQIKKYSLNEFLSLGEADSDPDFYQNYELINGEILPTESKLGPSERHGEVLSNLDTALKNYVKSKQLGRVFAAAAFDINLADSYVIPDVAFVAAGRIPAKFEGMVPAVPDLVAEINSPSDITEKISNKIQLYKQVKINLIWSIYLLEEFVRVYQLQSDGTYRAYTPELSHELNGEEVVPGFKMFVKELFE